MILHAGIRPFIVSLLFLVHPGKNHPLPPEKRLTMTKKSCQDSVGNVGMCMFKYDCIRQKGITLATCVDGFLFGACCMLKSDNFQDENKEENNLISQSYGFVTGMDLSNTQKYQKESTDVPSKSFPPSVSSISSETLINITTEANTPSLSTKADKDSFHRNESISGIHFSPGNNLAYALNGSTLSPSYVSSTGIVSNSTIGSTMSVMITHTENEVLHGELLNNSETDSTSINFSVHGMTEDSKYDENNSDTMFTNTLYTLHSSTDFTSNSTDPAQQQKTSIIQRTTATGPINHQTTHFVLNAFETKSPAQHTSISEDVLSTVPIQTDSTPDDHDAKDLKPTVDFSENAIPETSVGVTELLTLENVSEPFSSELEISSNENFLVENSSYERTGNDSSTFKFNSSESVEVKPFFHSSMQWSTEPAIPESLQSLIAQLTSLEVSSPLNLTYKVPALMNNNLQTFETQNLLTTQNEGAQIFSNDKIETYEEGEDFNEERNSTNDQQQTQITTSAPDLYETVSVTVTASNQSILNLNESIAHIFENLNESTVKIKPDASNYTMTEKTSSSSTPVEPYENETTLKTKQPAIFLDSTIQKELFNSTYVNGVETFIKITHMLDTFPTTDISTQSAHNSPPIEEVTDTTFDLNSTDVYTSSITLLDLNGTKMLDGITEPVIYENSSSVVLINNHEKKNLSVAQFADQNVDKDIISVNNIILPEDSSAGNRDSIFSFTVNNILERNDSTTEEVHLPQTENLDFLEEPLTLGPVSSESTDLLSEENTYLPYTESKIPSHDTLFLTVPSFENLSVTTEISKTTIHSTSPFDLTSDQSLINGEKTSNSKPHNSSVNANIDVEHEEYSDVPDYTFSMKPISQTTFSDFIRNSISTQSLNTDNITKLYSYTEHDSSLSGHLDHITTSAIPEYQNISTFSYLNLDETPSESMYELHILTLSGSTNVTYASTDITTPYTPAPESTTDMKDSTALSVPASSPENNSISYAIGLTSHIKYPDNSSINPATEFTIPPATSPESNSIIHATELTIPPTTSVTHNIEATIPPPTSSEHVSISSYGTATMVSTSTFPENSSIVLTTTSEPIQTSQFLSPNETSETNSTIQYEDTPGSANNVSATSMTSIPPHTSDKNFTSQEATMMGTTQITTQFSTAMTHPDTTTESHRWNYKKDCGVRLLQPLGRIVGGKNSYYGKWPWQALVKEATWLGLFVKNKCGGVLITAKYVLTAAHCQPGFFASLLVILGTHDLAVTFDTKASVIRNVRRMVVHRHYNAQTFENDLALLEMESKVEFLPHVVPICLPHRNEDFTGKMAFVTGWGKLTHGGDVPNILQEVQVPIVENEVCQRMFFHAGHKKSIRSNFVCAGYTNGGQDSCEGDSGGPLMVQREDKRWVLVGTVSHGIGCADPNLPGVYMRMSAYRPWIDSIIKKP